MFETRWTVRSEWKKTNVLVNQRRRRVENGSALLLRIKRDPEGRSLQTCVRLNEFERRCGIRTSPRVCATCTSPGEAEGRCEEALQLAEAYSGLTDPYSGGTYCAEYGEERDVFRSTIRKIKSSGASTAL